MSQLLETVYTYPGLKKPDVEKIIAQHRLVHIRKAEYLLKEGQVSREYFIVISGLLRSYVIGAEGEEITTAFHREGEAVVEVASLFRQEPTQEYIHSLSDCSCYAIRYEDFQALFLTIPPFAEWGRMWMTRALSIQKERMLNMLTRSAQDRYISLLEHYPEIIKTAPLKYIASYLGITDTSLSRIRKELSR